ncbi:MAG: hypothetical protein NVS4B8_15300 [Herpetosiphon sp.]
MEKEIITTVERDHSAVRSVIYVTHPLHDVAEQKCDVDSVGPMRMTPVVRYSLMALRVYLLFMMVLVLYRVLVLGGVLG